MIYYLILINILAFLLFVADKKKARTHAGRISEKMLFLAAGVGGSLGALIGMFFFHHKTRHWYFRVFIPLLCVLHAFLLFRFADFLF